MGTVRVWLFRLIVLLLGGLFVYSWTQPWWAADAKMLFGPTPYDVIIRPWGLWVDLQDMQSVVADAPMPPWFAPAMWVYFGLVLLALVVSLFIKDKMFSLGKINMTLPSFLVTLAGISYVVVVITAVVVAAIETGNYFNVKLIGESYVDLGGQYASAIEANLMPGYWLACATGPLLIIAGLLRNKIIGNK